MNKAISTSKAQNILRKFLISCNVDKICYHITGWSIRFISPQGSHITLNASAITMKNIKGWWQHLDKLPINLKDTNEAEDTIVAINLFTIINSHSLTKLSIDKIGNLHLEFDNNSKICVEALVPPIDWAWGISDENNDNIFTCDSGNLFCNPDYFS